MRNHRIFWACCSVIVMLAGFFMWHQSVDEPWPFHSETIRYQYRLDDDQVISDGKSFYMERIKDSPSPTDLNSLAAILIGQAKISGQESLYEEAEKLAQQSLSLRAKSNPEAQLVLVKTAQAKHLFTESLKMLETFNEEFGESDKSAVLKITAHLALMEAQKALAIANILVAKLPTLHTFVLRALAHERSGDLPNAFADLTAAIKVEDVSDRYGSAFARAILGRFYVNSGMLIAGRFVLSEALRIQSNLSLTLEQLARAEKLSENYDLAEQILTKAFATTPQAVFLFELSQVFRAQRNLVKEKQILELAEKTLREDLLQGRYGHRLLLARVLIANGDKKSIIEALALCEQELTTRPTFEVYQALSHANLVKGDWPAADAAIHHAIKTGVQSANAFYLASVIAGKLNHGDQAQKLLNRAQKLNPWITDLHEYSLNRPAQAN